MGLPPMQLGLVLLVVLSCVPLGAGALQIYDEFPDEIRPAERYVVYSHGLIVEGHDPRPVHPEFGVYDFPGIKQALFERGGFNLIAPHRPKDSDVDTYVRTLEAGVRRLVAAGVAPQRITLVGFSRGAQLTAAASSRLRTLEVGTVLMAVCSEGDLVRDPPILLGGPVLSIYETTDVVGSCAGLARRTALAEFEELAVSTGRRHGAFFLPLPEWVAPLKAWIERTNRRD